MQINAYIDFFNSYFKSQQLIKQLKNSIPIFKKSQRIFFIGNGGSNSICSHMMEDFMKIAKKQTFSFSDPALITCFSNDFGYEFSMSEWLKIMWSDGDLLVAISSSGNSDNINNAVDLVKGRGGIVVTLTGFDYGNRLSKKGIENFHLSVANYGIVECFHQTILHIILDSIVLDEK
jgi:D-sedoheptulose 7-phosphate isomerase